MSRPETSPMITSGADDIVRPTAEAERKMALRRQEFERFIRKLRRVPAPPIAVWFSLASCFFGIVVGLAVAAYVSAKSTSTVEPGTTTALWGWTFGFALATGVSIGAGVSTRRARQDHLTDIIDDMETTLESYKWPEAGE